MRPSSRAEGSRGTLARGGLTTDKRARLVETHAPPRDPGECPGFSSAKLVRSLRLLTVMTTSGAQTKDQQSRRSQNPVQAGGALKLCAPAEPTGPKMQT